jgi:hypothetical protein
MKKFIVSILVAFLVICSCYAEEFKFLGIPFGSSMKYAVSVMNSKGWTQDKRYISDDSCVFSGKTYAGMETEYIILAFENDEMYGVSINMDKADAIDILSAIVKKYNLEKFSRTEILYSTPNTTPDYKIFFKVTDDGLDIVYTKPKTRTVDESEI